MSKHTPGPWSVDATDVTLLNQDQARFWINAAGLQHVAFIDGLRTAESTANAHLIAAAPDLLQALKTISVWAENGRSTKDFDDIRRLADVAVSRSTGGSET